jgi:NADH:ubiquinone oxidoreductase subunit 6 (subunit J)
MTGVVALGLFGSIMLAGRAAWITGSNAFGAANLNGTAEAVADELFGTWMIVFLSTVMLLTIAALGTIALAYFRDVPEEEMAE